jgi:hypothetical protein
MLIKSLVLARTHFSFECGGLDVMRIKIDGAISPGNHNVQYRFIDVNACLCMNNKCVFGLLSLSTH